ncbi:MAG TPA: selenocysteine-specific translation elongation factor [Armatimonadota bacterium]|nr:selenocysteine-specific translation elongation factor [Armatimonadota bacterium]
MNQERHVVFGTAGHVDHGKSALVRALTGTDPDRLAEEKARGMTIDLGFAFLPLPQLAEPAAIVDVPGHEMFVRNMVAGAAGVDAVLFVVAADEGVMPQTVEHLDVLRYLGVTAGVVALTKRDKVGPQRIRGIAAQVSNLLSGSPLHAARIIPVSAVTGDGLPELHAELARIAGQVATHSAEGVFRLPVDRVFTLRGVGTVITGTVISGVLRAGETVTCLPADRQLRARGLQVRNQAVPRVVAGQRAAVNLADVSKEELRRGDVLVTAGALASTLIADVRLALSSQAPRALAQRTRVRVHHGTAEVMARVLLLEGDALAPAQSALVQLRLEAPLVAVAGDRFVVRSYSPMQVIGGGVILDPHAPKRRTAAGAAEVADREQLPLPELVVEALDRAGASGAALDGLRVTLGVSGSALQSALNELTAQGRAVGGRRNRWFSAAAVRDMEAAITARLAALHAGAPLKSFVQLNRVTSVAAPTAEQRECLRLALESLVGRGAVLLASERLRLARYQVQWAGRFAAAREKILAACSAAGIVALSIEQLAAASGLSRQDTQQVLDALVDAGDLRQLAPGALVQSQALARSREAVRKFLALRHTMTVGEARELLGASRKHLLPFLEWLDREGVTLRHGDVRVLRPSPASGSDA